MLNIPGQINDPKLGRRLRGRREIAEFIGVHPRTVDNWRQRGLPVYQPGRELEAWTVEITCFLRGK